MTKKLEEHSAMAHTLSGLIGDTIRNYGQAQLDAGNQVLGNDIIAALAHQIAILIANLPDKMLAEIHEGVGLAILTSVEHLRTHGGGAVVVEPESTMVQ